MLTAREIQDSALRVAIEEDLAKCTEPQIAFFHRIFGETVAPDKLGSAYGLVQRTLVKNEKGEL